MKSYKYKIRRLSPEIAARLEQTLEVCRELYNAALQERRGSYRITGKSVTWAEQCRQIKEIRRERPDVASVNVDALHHVLNRLDAAFGRFFESSKAGVKAGFPRFKSRSRFNSITYRRYAYGLDGDTLRLSKIGRVRLRMSRPIEGTIKTCTIAREADGWYAVFAVDEDRCPVIARTGQSVGVDVGVERFATLPCAVLEDGTRVLTQTGIFKAIGRTGKSPGKFQGDPSGLSLPVFLGAKNLIPFITKELIEASTPVKFRPSNMNGWSKNAHGLGYRAEILPMTCAVYLDAYLAGVLSNKQIHVPDRAEHRPHDDH